MELMEKVEAITAMSIHIVAVRVNIFLPAAYAHGQEWDMADTCNSCLFGVEEQHLHGFSFLAFGVEVNLITNNSAKDPISCWFLKTQAYEVGGVHPAMICDDPTDVICSDGF